MPTTTPIMMPPAWLQALSNSSRCVYLMAIRRLQKYKEVRKKPRDSWNNIYKQVAEMLDKICERTKK